MRSGSWEWKMESLRRNAKNDWNYEWAVICTNSMWTITDAPPPPLTSVTCHWSRCPRSRRQHAESVRCPRCPGRWSDRTQTGNYRPAPTATPCKKTHPKASYCHDCGSSIVRGVALLVHGNDCDASVYVYPGRTERQINAQIKHIPSSDVTVIAAGANNIDSQPLGQCKEEIRQIIDNASCKRRDKIVIMSRIPPRHDKPFLNKKIHEVNDFIVQQVKQRLNLHILIHDLSRTDFKKDGLHFNEIGVGKYAYEIRHLLRNINGKWGFATEEPVLDFTHARCVSAVSPIANQFSSTQPMCDVLSRYVRILDPLARLQMMLTAL